MERYCLSYLRYDSFYLETTKILGATHPLLLRRVVKDDVSGNCNVVAPAMKLEQSIQRPPTSEAGKQEILLRNNTALTTPYLSVASEVYSRIVGRVW